MESEVAMHKKEIVRLSGAIQEMDAGAAEATKIRQEENKAATAALQDYANGQSMLQKAIQVLSDFYERKAAESAALLQKQTFRAQRQRRQESVDGLSFLQITTATTDGDA